MSTHPSETPSNPAAPPRKGGRKGLMVLLIIAILLMAGGIFVGLMLWKQHRVNDYTSYNNEYFVAAPELSVMERTRDGGFRFVDEVPYGTPFALEKTAVDVGGKKYYRIVPFESDSEYTLPSEFKGKDCYIETTCDFDLESACYLDYYNLTFPVKEAQNLPSYVKKTIFNYDYDHESDLSFTQNPDRIKSMIAYGDFDLDGEEDVAVILESIDPTESWTKLFVLCYNKDLKKSYIAYEDASYYADSKPTVRTFRKDTPIYMDTEEQVKAPNNGIFQEFPRGGDSYAIFYDPKSKEFVSYLQRPLSEITDEGEEEYYEHNGDEEEPSHTGETTEAEEAG